MFEDLESVFHKLYVRPTPGRVLIVGSRVYKYRADRRALYADVLGVDMAEGEGVDVVLDLEDSLPEDLGKFSHIECFSVLEHVRRPWLMAENLERLLVEGGSLHVQVPFVWRVHSYPSDYWRFTTEAIRSLFRNIKWAHLMYANTHLVEEGKVPLIFKDGFRFLARTQVFGFGRLT